MQVNGSRIRSWWIQHHYWGIATCMILLVLPVDSPAVQFCVSKFLWWAWWYVPPPTPPSSMPSTHRFDIPRPCSAVTVADICMGD